MPTTSETDRWHLLLNSRYFCESCLTRFFARHTRCPACHRFGRLRRLDSQLRQIARSEPELRTLMSGGTPAPSRKNFKAPN